MHRDGRVEVRVMATREMVERAIRTAGLRPRQIRSVGEDVEQHIGRAENLSAVPMGGHEAEEPLQVQHRPLHSGGEDACQGTGGREDPTIHTPPIVEQIADDNLCLLLLSGCGGWGRVGGGALGVRRAVVKRDVEGRRGRGLDAKGSEAEQHGVDVPRVGQGSECVGRGREQG